MNLLSHLTTVGPLIVYSNLVPAFVYSLYPLFAIVLGVAIGRIDSGDL